MAAVKAGPLRVGAFKSAPGHDRAVACVQDWTRERFSLPDGASVMVTELECRRPCCPPVETVVAFWLDGDQRRHFRVLKPTAEIVAGDLPPAWLKDFLCAEQDDQIDCC
jgi:nitrate reductase delta subunit